MKFKLLIVILLMTVAVSSAQEYSITSPDKNIHVDIQVHEKIYYSVIYKGERIMQFSPLTLNIEGKILGADAEVQNAETIQVDKTIETIWGSRSTIRDLYNQLTLKCKENFDIEFRVYNTGVAYRFMTHLKQKSVKVVHEEVAFRFDFGVSAWLLDSQSYETNYMQTVLDVEEITNFNNSMNKIFLPMIVQPTPTVKVAITEAAVYDYPSLFLDRGNDYENFLLGTFEKYTLTTKTGGFSNYSQLADKNADYIAIVNGEREFPWRLLIISDDDRTFTDCDLVYQLSKPCALEDTEWIEPGKVAWEWWHDYVVENQQFIGGVNTETYLYHIDFAAKYNLEYILIDWLWTDKYDLTLFNPDVELQKITDYATSKNVKVIVWCPGHTLYRQLDKALDLFASYGVAGVKADFFGREDQTCNAMYEEMARATAERKMLIDFHGCAKPTGLSRTYPNVINYEAVAGNEWNKLSDDKVTVEHRVIVPFTRALQGTMDFTPGGMRNLQSGHTLRFTLPVVHGTRSGEMAMFVIYNEALKMLCDAPSVYEREPDIIEFIAPIPTTWDETKTLDAEFGDHIVQARQTGDTWYVAGLNGDHPKTATINFSFLDDGEYTATILKDGPNAHRVGTDYLFEKKSITNQSTLKLDMARGGGFVIEVQK